MKFNKAFRFAIDPRTNEGMLRSLAGIKNWKVRYAVAENPSTPNDVLELLSNDKEKEVRFAVASNLSASEKILIELAEDKYARLAVASNPVTPVHVLQSFIGKNPALVAGVGSNISTPVEILGILSKHTHDEVREAVAVNPRTPLRVVAKMRNDHDGYVSHGAKTSYRKRVKK